MSPILITGLVLGGLFLLVAIGYINHIVERNRLEKARLRADLNDRIRRCANLSGSLPGQMMSPPLKQALTRLELQLAERLQSLDRQDAKLRQRIADLQAELAKGDGAEMRNPPQPIMSEARAKEVRFMLEDLSAQITHAAKQGLMDQNEAKRWMRECQRLSVMLHIELFGNVGKAALEQGQPRQARLAFERAVQFIRKQPDPAPFQAQLKRLEAQLAHTNALVLEQGAPQADEPSALTDGLKEFDDEDIWKKKNIYE
ncbi:hypothetical protein [Stutzerimonas azotifigens]|uniref:hypothetical protein n=1 Tax=Stutzerimonas azotifigens TaxID=291995 RepID=UPI000424F3F2|nr:hypothetical protein [Stutzerimonas azotifigens]